MPGPKVSQKNITQNIMLHLPACLLPTVHPSAVSSLGKQCTRPSTWSKKKKDLSDQASIAPGSSSDD